jgi:hypothetical protein
MESYQFKDLDFFCFFQKCCTFSLLPQAGMRWKEEDEVGGFDEKTTWEWNAAQATPDDVHNHERGRDEL